MKTTRSADVCVVGSGPAGAFAAATLVSRGKRVLLLDVGLQPPHAVQELKARLLAEEPGTWSTEDRQRITAGFSTPTKGVALKRSFGSDYAYQLPHEFPACLNRGSELFPSFALGGFSSVWGCAALPYRAKDLQGWPLSISDLEAGYSAALKLATLSGTQDKLSEEFPLYGVCDELPLSHQASRVLGTLNKYSESLRSQGVRFGQARVLFNQGRRCIRCGYCLFGCPKQVLFNSEALIQHLKAQPGFEYLGGTYVERFHETTSLVEIHTININTEQRELFSAQTLLIGAGVIPSAHLVLSSLQRRDEVTLLDSQYFLQPVLTRPGTGNVLKQDFTAFAQLFLEIENRAIDLFNVHLQFYTFSRMTQDAIQSKIRFPLDWLPKWFRGRFLGMFGVLQGYLHSDSSARMTMAYDESQKALVLRGIPNPGSRMKIENTIRLLRRNWRRLGFFPIPGALEITLPGRGFHVGGTFPMSSAPVGHQTDVLGRPFDLQRVHLIDASTFPSIPAATITLTVVANAIRIAEGVAHET